MPPFVLSATRTFSAQHSNACQRKGEAPLGLPLPDAAESVGGRRPFAVLPYLTVGATAGCTVGAAPVVAAGLAVDLAC